jgi:hypothetical protein
MNINEQTIEEEKNMGKLVINENLSMAHVQAAGVITGRLRQGGCPAESIDWLVSLFAYHKELMLSAHNVLSEFEAECGHERNER